MESPAVASHPLRDLNRPLTSDFCSLISGVSGDCPQTNASRPRHADADALRADVLR